MVIVMKLIKVLLPICLSIVIGYFFGTFLYNQYNDSLLAFNKTKVIYFLQQGVYKDNNSLNEDLSNLSVSYVSEENDLYHVYIGMTSSFELAEKIKGIYKEQGITLYIKEKEVNNQYFNNEIEQYDKLLNSCNEYNQLNKILDAIVDSYESNVMSS